MNKIEPNMYVRTLFGIKKIDHIDNKKTVWKYLYKINDDNEFYALSDNDVIKASNNIIDLIQENDFVNGHRVIKVDRESLELDIENSMYGCGSETIDGNKDIKSIVTKEQFSSMKYRLGE